MKKIYIKPAVKAVNMLPIRPIAISAEANSFYNPQTNERLQLSREADGFDWDEEEEDTGGWFK